MSSNKYEPHLLVLPEDDANRQLADGFMLDPNCNYRAIQVLNVAGGWGKVIDIFKNDYLPRMRVYPKRRIILLMDFDDKPEDRKINVEKRNFGVF